MAQYNINTKLNAFFYFPAKLQRRSGGHGATPFRLFAGVVSKNYSRNEINCKYISNRSRREGCAVKIYLYSLLLAKTCLRTFYFQGFFFIDYVLHRLVYYD